MGIYRVLRRRYIFAIVVILLAVSALTSPVWWQRWNGHQLRQLAQQCRRARNDGLWDELQVLANQWATLDPLNGEPWFHLGIAANAQGAWIDAADYFWRVPDTSPQAIPAMIEISRLSFGQLNEPLRGVQACERILRIDPHAEGAQQQLIWFYAMTLQRAKLRRQILNAIRLKCEPREAYVYYFLLYSLRSQEAIELNMQWLKTTPDSEVFLVASAMNLKDPITGSPETTDDLSASIANDKLNQVNRLLQRFPDNLELIAYLTEERFVNGDFVEAAEILKNTPESAAQDCRFWRFKGWLHEANGELNESILAYQQALTLHPSDWNTMNRLANVERRVHNTSEVKRLTDLIEYSNDTRLKLRTEKAVEVASLETLKNLAVLYRNCGDSEIAQALEARLSRTRSH